MKNIYLLAAILLMVFSSCSTKLDLVNTADPIPVVYFQMNPNDNINYLTLTRTFSGDSNAYKLSRKADQVFYANANIRLEAWVGDYKVDETYFEPSARTKVPGIFAEVPGYCYQSKHLLHQSNWEVTHFRLVISGPGMVSPAFSKIALVGPPIIKSQYDNQISLYPKMNEIGIAPGLGTAYCDLICGFRYRQMEGIWVNHSDTFLLRRDMRFETGRTDYLYAELFYKQVAANIKPVNDTIVRKFTSLDLIMYAGDIYFRDYVDTYSNAGNLDLPPKGNITNGLGLFTMLRTAIKDNMKLDRITHDSLCLGQYTKQLGFVRW